MDIKKKHFVHQLHVLLTSTCARNHATSISHGNLRMWWGGLVAFGETCLGVRWKGSIQGMRTQRSGTAKGNQPMDCERSVVYDSIWFNFMLWVNQKAVMNSHPSSWQETQPHLPESTDTTYPCANKNWSQPGTTRRLVIPFAELHIEWKSFGYSSTSVTVQCLSKQEFSTQIYIYIKKYIKKYIYIH